MPLLLRGLDLPDVEMRVNVVETLLKVSRDETREPGIITEHASTIVTALLKNCVPGPVSSTVSLEILHIKAERFDRVGLLVKISPAVASASYFHSMPRGVPGYDPL